MGDAFDESWFPDPSLNDWIGEYELSMERKFEGGSPRHSILFEELGEPMNRIPATSVGTPSVVIEPQVQEHRRILTANIHKPKLVHATLSPGASSSSHGSSGVCQQMSSDDTIDLTAEEKKEHRKVKKLTQRKAQRNVVKEQFEVLKGMVGQQTEDQTQADILEATLIHMRTLQSRMEELKMRADGRSGHERSRRQGYPLAPPLEHSLVFHNSTLPIVRTGFDGYLEDCNQQFVDVYGYKSKKDLVGVLHTAQLMHPKDHDKVQLMIGALVTGPSGTTGSVIERTWTGDGRCLKVQTVAWSVRVQEHPERDCFLALIIPICRETDAAYVGASGAVSTRVMAGATQEQVDGIFPTSMEQHQREPSVVPRPSVSGSGTRPVGQLRQHDVTAQPTADVTVMAGMSAQRSQLGRRPLSQGGSDDAGGIMEDISAFPHLEDVDGSGAMSAFLPEFDVPIDQPDAFHIAHDTGLASPMHTEQSYPFDPTVVLSFATLAAAMSSTASSPRSAAGHTHHNVIL